MKLKILALILSAPLAYSATTLTYEFSDVQVSSVQPPTGAAPWITTTFTSVDVNKVEITINGNLTPPEYLTKLAFNLDGDAFDVGKFAVTPVSLSGQFDQPTISLGINSFNGGNGATFDFAFEFSTSNAQGGAKRFNQTDSLSYLITYFGAEPFTADSFDSFDTSGRFKAVAHVQSIGSGNTSAWIVPSQIPEASSALLGGLGILTLLRRRR